jgi:hypothetical protein
MTPLRRKKQVATTLSDTIPPVLEKVIGKYIDITDFRPEDDTLEEFKDIVHMFDVKISNDIGFDKMLLSICSANNIQTVKYLQETYSDTKYLDPDYSRYYLSLILVNLIKNNYDELFILIVNIYKPQLVTDMFLYMRGMGIKYDIFANCSDRLLKFIADHIVSCGHFREFIEIGDKFLENMYSSLLDRQDSQILFYYLEKLENFIAYSFSLYISNLSQDRLKSLLIRSFKINDLKLARFIYEGRNITGYIEESKLMDIFREKCTEGNSDFTDFMEIMNVYVLRKNINVFELIFIACMNQHLNVVKSLVNSYKLNVLRLTDREENDIRVIYNTVSEKGYTEIAEYINMIFRRVLKKEVDSLKEATWV